MATAIFGLCTECEREAGLYHGLCEVCEEGKVVCQVCGEWWSSHDDCRHIFYSDCYWNGAGYYENAWDECRESFFLFLDILARYPREGRDGWDWGIVDNPGRDLIAVLERKLAADNFWTFHHGPLIGGPGDLDFRYQNRPDWCPPFATLNGYVFQRLLPNDDDGMWRDGCDWLMSLESEKTKKANARTLRWILEWRLSRKV